MRWSCPARPTNARQSSRGREDTTRARSARPQAAQELNATAPKICEEQRRRRSSMTLALPCDGPCRTALSLGPLGPPSQRLRPTLGGNVQHLGEDVAQESSGSSERQELDAICGGSAPRSGEPKRSLVPADSSSRGSMRGQGAQVAVGHAGALAALVDRPHDQRLAAARVTGGEDAVGGRRVRARLGVAARVALDAQRLEQLLLGREEAHRQQHELDRVRLLGARRWPRTAACRCSGPSAPARRCRCR